MIAPVLREVQGKDLLRYDPMAMEMGEDLDDLQREAKLRNRIHEAAKYVPQRAPALALTIQSEYTDTPAGMFWLRTSGCTSVLEYITYVESTSQFKGVVGACFSTLHLSSGCSGPHPDPAAPRAQVPDAEAQHVREAKHGKTTTVRTQVPTGAPCRHQ